MRKEPRWVSREVVLALHERLLADHGGAPGLLDEGLLDGTLAGPRNRFAYGEVDIFRPAAAYAYAITQNHPFADGNKRVALTIAGVFLELNGFRLDAPEPDAVAVLAALSTREMDAEGFAEWLRTSSSALRSRGRARDKRTHKNRHQVP